jgi:uracil-DNA glycosylase family protein
MTTKPAQSAATYFPSRISLRSLRGAATDCRACPLWKTGTQTVFGEGPAHAPLLLVGEQPGNEEDSSGHPFVGPAGRLLNDAMAEAGIDRTQAYVTNAVKHFKWTLKGQRRLHKKPAGHEIRACLPWLEKEIEVVRPSVLVCLGATAAQALLGPAFRVTRQRGQVIESRWCPRTVATVHPSSILRARTSEDRTREMRLFVKDLTFIAALLRPPT